MKLTKRQADAINQIIMEEVQGALKGRSQAAGHVRRGQLFESIGEEELFELSDKLIDAEEVLTSVANALSADAKLKAMAEKALGATVALSSAIQDQLTGDDPHADVYEADDADLDEDDDFEPLPMHPRGHEEKVDMKLARRPPPPPWTVKPRPPRPPARPWDTAADGDVELPPTHPRGRR